MKGYTDTWPKPMAEAAYHGLVGDVVNTILPETESDAANLLVSFLIAFGNSIGRNAHVMIEDTPHYANEFAVMVGESSIGRKGTAWNRIQKIMKLAEQKSRRNEMWTDRIKYGLSTGEGLIQQLSPIKRKNADGEVEEVPVDKRILVIESEFARVLTVMNRPDNTLSSILRCAWDSTTLGVMTKHNDLEVTDPHVSKLGHITLDELRKLLTDTQRANGFANRYLWQAVRRSKELPFGGNSIDYGELASRVAQAQEFARGISLVRWGSDAREMWPEQYKKLTEPRVGLLGALTDRGAAHVRRLSLIYALLDRCKFLKVSHMLAALEVWRYSDDSVKHIFGTSLGDDTADAILRELKRHPKGLTRTDIHNLFNRNKSSTEIDRGLNKLEDYGLAAPPPPDEGKKSRGRPREVWRYIIR